MRPMDRPDDPDAENPAEVAIPIEDAIDLHAFAPRDVVAVVESYLEAARRVGGDNRHAPPAGRSRGLTRAATAPTM